MSEDVGQGTSDPQGTYLLEGEKRQMCSPDHGYSATRVVGWP